MSSKEEEANGVHSDPESMIVEENPVFDEGEELTQKCHAFHT